jgi:hypothetical protein
MCRSFVPGEAVGDQTRTPWSSRGRALPPATRAEFEARFGFDFSRVRIHQGGEADRAAAAAGAPALARGADIVLGNGVPPLGAVRGRHILAHELAHVVQQSRHSGSSAGAERDASRAADAFVRGARVTVGASAPVGIAAYGNQSPALKASSEHGGTPTDEEITRAQLGQIMPELGSAPVETQEYYTSLVNRTFEMFRIDTIESRAFFLAHAAVESRQFKFLVEADFRQAYRARERGADDPDWAPGAVTSGQRSDFTSTGRRYDLDTAISPAGRPFEYIGRGPLMVTKSYGYKQAVAVLEAWGQQLGAEGRIQEAAQALHAAAELERDPALAAVPEYGFLLSAAHFKATGTTTSGRTVGLDYLASKNAPTTKRGFFGASSRMHGLGGWSALEALKTTNPGAHAIHEANLNEKFPSYQRALRVLCAGKSKGICTQP